MPTGTANGQLIDWRICGLPDIDQVRAASKDEGKNGLPANGINFCVPTSVTNVFTYLASKGIDIPGIPKADPLLPENYSVFTEVIRSLGSEMGTDPLRGTGGEGATAAVRSRLATAHANGVTQVFSVADERGAAPDPRGLGVDGASGAFVFPIIGFYDAANHYTGEETGFVLMYERTGGHMMTGVGMTVAPSAPVRMVVNDAATDYVLDTVQGDFAADTHTLTPMTLRVRRFDELPNGGEEFSSSPQERWAWDGNDKVLYDGFMRITPVAAWTRAGKTLRVVRTDPLAPVAVPAPSTYQVGGKVVDLALSAAMSEPVFVTSKGNGAWQLNPLTGAKTRFAKVPNASAVAVGGPTQNVYVAGGKRLTSFTHSGRALGSRKLATPLSALEYDDVSNRLVGLSRKGDRLLFFGRGLKRVGARRLGDKALARGGGLAVGADGTIALTQPGTRALVVAKGGKAAASRSRGSVARARLRKVKLPRKGAVTGVAVGDLGHLFVSQRGRLVEYGRGGKPISDSPFTGERAGAVLAVTRSFSNSNAPIDTLPFEPLSPEPAPPEPAPPEPGVPDLVLAFDNPADLTTLSVHNVGTGPAGPFKVRFGPRPVTELSFTGLAAGASETMPVGCPGERVATVDPDNTVSEANEANNTLAWECHE